MQFQLHLQRTRSFRRVCLAMAACVLALPALALAGQRDAQWKSVDEAVKQNLPKTAIEQLNPIITEAIAEKSYPEAIKAIGRKVALEGRIEGDKAEGKIRRFQTELEKAPAEMKPAMEAILAHWYWQYFQQHRWQFMQRTQMGTASGPDFETWDLARILQEVDRHFTAALADDSTAKKTPIKTYDDLLQKGSAPDNYRPTLYDFLAYDALEFYKAGEHAATISEDNFEVSTTDPIFGTASEFLQWQPQTTDASSPQLKAIQLYQALMKFHQRDRDRSAYYDADLARIVYGHNIARGEDKNERYRAALGAFITATERHEISARAIADLVTQLLSEGEPAKAHEWAERGQEAFPDSHGSAECWNLIQRIEAKSATLVTERVWNAPWPTLNVTYRNVEKVYFRAVSIDPSDYLARSRWNFGSVPYDELPNVLRAKPALEWSASLPRTTDYKDHTESLPAPGTLKKGLYFVVASYDRNFSTTDNQISIAPVWVSDLALVVRTNHQASENDGFVLNAVTGEPIAGAKVNFWQRDRGGFLQPSGSTKTDDEGRFALVPDDKNIVIVAHHGDDVLASGGEIYSSSYRGEAEREANTLFFTDRALYRPGQTISYKGVSIFYDAKAGRYVPAGGERGTVVFNDANGQEIARSTYQTNDYGSFSGVFTAPRDRLVGSMSLQVLGRPSTVSFRVEEYKRPKFQVELKAPAEAAKLGAPVVVTGSAMAYTGAAIGGAKVKWRVERAAQLPYWCWWWRPPASKAIAHGTAVVQSDGTFKLEFPAEPDRSVPEKNEPTFVFTVHVDVTDTTGETRSNDRSIHAAYTALQVVVDANDWQTADTPVELSITTSSHNGDPQSASGTLKVFTLKQPASVQRSPLYRAPVWYVDRGEPKSDPTNPDSWELGSMATESDFKTDTTGKAQVKASLPPGIYRAMVETKDRFGKQVTARRTIQVVNTKAPHYSAKLANFIAAPKWSLEPGETFTALWGTGYETGRAFVELVRDGKTLKRYWTSPDRTQELIEQPITEDMRGGFTLRVTYVRENRAYTTADAVQVPWSNKRLSLSWEHFRSKLEPGQKETWTAVVKGPDGKGAAAELVATLYDASLDQFTPHSWPAAFPIFPQEHEYLQTQFQNTPVMLQALRHWDPSNEKVTSWRYRLFTGGILSGADGDETDMLLLMPFQVQARGDVGYAASASLSGSRMRKAENNLAGVVSGGMAADLAAPAASTDVVLGQGVSSTASEKPSIDLSKVTARKNLNETAFFFPKLVSGNDGTVKLVFTMPEALTEWKFLGFAHDKELRAGLLTDKAVTSKDLMVEPNPPRFLREGDVVEFTVKVSNQSDIPQRGKVKLNFADAASLQSVDTDLANTSPEQAFDIPAKQSRSYSWRITVPDGMGFLMYKAVGATSATSDGEEGYVPVLSKRVLVTESLPLPIRGKTTKQFEFKKLLNSGSSNTLRNESLTVEMVSQPAWYAVMALPYLMEYPYECSEQVFNRYYANQLARHIANSDPKVRRIFEQWKGTTALESPLQKNQDLKSVMLEETPWLREAQSESQSRRNVGLLFDENRLNEEASRALHTLSERQLNDGLWSWFPGSPSSDYISLYITTGFGRLRHLGVEVDAQPAIKSLSSLDAWMTDNYQRIQKSKTPEDYVPSSIDALYLYGRSFFLKDQPIAPQHQAAIDFFQRQARKFWVQLHSRQSQAHLALALRRLGDKDTPQAIMKSLKERSLTSEEMGMYWQDPQSSWWWYDAPIETQALMIEAFAEITGDAQSVEDCKVWLLKQKQTQAWDTTKATADAVYGLLLRGNNLLASDALVEVSLGGKTIKPEVVEAGTGFYREKFVRTEIKPEMGNIVVKKTDDGVSWGSVHWQYLEDIAKITPDTGTPLKLKKSLFVRETTSKGQVLKPVTGPVSVGDELIVRLELRSDRDMDFVHLKDQRGSGTEPVNVLSRYRYQDGLGYYESTRDTASHFFIDHLRPGVYVFEYPIRVQLKGHYETGLAEIQCMYAPEFNSHSESIALEVK